MSEKPRTLANLGVPPPGFFAEDNYWPFRMGEPSLDISHNKDITTLLGDYYGGRPGSDDVGPLSQNVEDRRGEPPYTPGVIDALRSLAGGYLAYPGRHYGPYDADIDASLQRTNAAYAIDPALRLLANKEAWFKQIDAGEPGKPAPENVKREYQGLSATRPTTLANLGETLGDPRGTNPTLQQAMAMQRAAPGPSGPMPSDEQIQAYLRMTGQIYPPLTTQVNPAGWEAFLANGPHSLNIEDRRGINRRR